jgi:D-alanine-D-alanine ligase
MRKIKIGVFFGGRSAEHDISIVSAKNVIKNLDRKKYDVIPIGIGKEGNFCIGKSADYVDVDRTIYDVLEEFPVGDVIDSTTFLAKLSNRQLIDVAFPVLHGPFGEDGSIQGMFFLFNIPFVGSGVLGSSVCMDKDVARRLIQTSGIPCAKSFTFHRHEMENIRYNAITAELGEILFVKPANLGSSVGISKVKSKGDFDHAVASAFSYDNKILVEEFIKGREIECAVLGNEYPKASIPGEIIVNNEFYSYEAKYIDKNGASLEIPADLPRAVSDKIRELAVKTFKILGCEGMARVDFFLSENGDTFVNEVNTIPGFTNVSMYPKLWEASGVQYEDLLDKLIELAIARFKRDNKLLQK